MVGTKEGTYVSGDFGHRRLNLAVFASVIVAVKFEGEEEKFVVANDTTFQQLAGLVYTLSYVCGLYVRFFLSGLVWAR